MTTKDKKDNAIQKLWVYLSGKKRNIALVYWSLAMPAIAIIWPDGAPSEVNKACSLIGLVLTYVGLGHAAVKASSRKKKVAAQDSVDA